MSFFRISSFGLMQNKTGQEFGGGFDIFAPPNEDAAGSLSLSRPQRKEDDIS
jgi:hypothetical protein